MALQTLSEATPTGAIHWPDVLQRKARAVWQQAAQIDGCSRQNSAYRLTRPLSMAAPVRMGAIFMIFFAFCEGLCYTKE